MSRKDGGQVYPIVGNGGTLMGITRRDWLAGLAMQGFCADTNCAVEGIAKISYKLADDMIAEGNK